NILIPAGTGELASGLHGEGRMAEPDEIVALLSAEIKKKLPLANYKILVTAGPTYEAIDPVRFIGNHSSGKMGFAIADELAALGADVTIITGPTAEVLQHQSINRINITSAAEMLEACMEHYPAAKACIMSAAVADYTPVNIASQKIKKQDAGLNIDLKKTTDILKTLGQTKRPDQILVGFALETENEEQYAVEKLQKKNLDLIILNSLNDKGAGFKGDTNKITMIDKYLQKTIFTLKTKTEVARDICQKVTQLIHQ
ncbi:MAG: bifunctional phosphopantothenoylcysteine decarboxylase/phosphopantothenate--cysteine ligase CoaBC, partial [Sphingobacteriaceae bacterium]